MNKLFLRLLLIPALLCAILGVGFLSTTGQAHAATLQAQTVQPAFSCTFGDVEMDVYESTAHTCFSATGTITLPASIYLTNIAVINTGHYAVSWDWIDCNGNEHQSAKPELTIVRASNSPGGYAGCPYMSKVFNITLSPVLS